MGKAVFMVISLIVMAWMLMLFVAVALCRAAARGNNNMVASRADRSRYVAATRLRS
jgi:hypothetical protein